MDDRYDPIRASTLGAAEPGSGESQALKELEDLVNRRLRESREHGVTERTVEEVFEDGIAVAGPGADA